MNDNSEPRAPRDLSLALGAILIIAGIFFFLGELFHIPLTRYLWPFFVIVPGVLLLVFGLTWKDAASEALAIVGGIVTMTGALLFCQNITGLWASWAYAWALIAPTSVGLALMAYGTVKGLPQKVRDGTRVATIGVILFAVGAVSFELIIGISGFGLGRYGWPVLLIGLGVLWLLSALLPRKRRS